LSSVIICPICNSSDCYEFLKRSEIPVHQNLVCDRIEIAQNIMRGDLSLSLCNSCGFVFNHDFDDRKLNYGEHYDNTQDLSPSFSSYLDELISFLVNKCDLANKQIVEVGCGKGNFLKKLISSSLNNKGYGFDPSYVGELSLLNGSISFRQCYYDSSCTDIPADIVICRHVIEHIASPIDLLNNIHQALSNCPNTKLFLETPCVEWILENKIIYDLFYEHCSYFSQGSITKALNLAGFKVKSIQHKFGGQYMWVLASLNLPGNTDTAPVELGTTEDLTRLSHLANTYALEEKIILDKWYKKVQKLTQREKIAVWGAGAKGVTFANAIDPKNQLIDAIIDVNQNKQGRYLPGTGHLIIPPEQITARKISTVIVMNDNYMDEIKDLISQHNIDTKIMNAERY